MYGAEQNRSCALAVKRPSAGTEQGDWNCYLYEPCYYLAYKMPLNMNEFPWLYNRHKYIATTILVSLYQ